MDGTMSGLFFEEYRIITKGIDVPIYRIFYYLVVSRRDYMNETVCDIRSQTMYDMHNVKNCNF